jgi:hypothetical protein
VDSATARAPAAGVLPYHGVAMTARPFLLLLLLAAHAGGALAQYKCVAANGAVTFQDAPCVGAKSGQKLDIAPKGQPPASAVAAAAPPGSVDKRMLANYQRMDQRDALEQAVRAARDAAARRRAQHDTEVAAVRQRFADNPPDGLSLADALADIESRYRALAVIDDDGIRSAQAALDDFDRAAAASARR